MRGEARAGGGGALQKNTETLPDSTRQSTPLGILAQCQGTVADDGGPPGVLLSWEVWGGASWSFPKGFLGSLSGASAAITPADFGQIGRCLGGKSVRHGNHPGAGTALQPDPCFLGLPLLNWPRWHSCKHR